MPKKQKKKPPSQTKYESQNFKIKLTNKTDQTQIFKTMERTQIARRPAQEKKFEHDKTGD